MVVTSRSRVAAFSGFNFFIYISIIINITTIMNLSSVFFKKSFMTTDDWDTGSKRYLAQAKGDALAN